MVQESSGIGDLTYVRQVVERAGDRSVTPPACMYMWAVIVLAGFALFDLAPRYGLLYWLAMPVVGAVASVFIGRSYRRALGIRDRRLGLRIGSHWFTFLLGYLMLLVLPLTGQITWPIFGVLMMLLTSLFFLTASFHLDRRYLPLGIVTALIYLALLFLPIFSWTLIGAVFAAGFVMAGWLAGASRTSAHTGGE